MVCDRERWGARTKWRRRAGGESESEREREREGVSVSVLVCAVCERVRESVCGERESACVCCVCCVCERELGQGKFGQGPSGDGGQAVEGLGRMQFRNPRHLKCQRGQCKALITFSSGRIIRGPITENESGSAPPSSGENIF